MTTTDDMYQAEIRNLYSSVQNVTDIVRQMHLQYAAIAGGYRALPNQRYWLLPLLYYGRFVLSRLFVSEFKDQDKGISPF